MRRSGSQLDRTKALATAARMLDRTFIRVGSEEYAAANSTYGLATMRSRHLTIEDDVVLLDFTGKGGKRREAELEDVQLAKILAEMDALPGYEVLKYRSDDGTVCAIRPADVNAYIEEQMGEDFTAKDFRTWAGTVAAALALDELGVVGDGRAQQKAVAGVCRVAANLLGNTPAVARASYINPRVIEHFLDGTTISKLRDEVERVEGHSAQELAVLAVLRRGLREVGQEVAA
jgi:DNA topoisomerase I